MMLRFQWNALRVGDAVLVHDDDDLRSPLKDATVVIVQPRPTNIGNDLAVRLTHRPGTVIRPRREAVHSVDTGHSGCWRCALFAPRRVAEHRARHHVPDDRTWQFPDIGEGHAAVNARVAAELSPPTFAASTVPDAAE